MAAVPIATLQTRLNIAARDGSDVTFTPAEKTEALTHAINDPYVIQIVRDNSLTTTANNDTYTIPATITKLLKVGIMFDTVGKPYNIEGWNEYGGNLYFDRLPSSGFSLVLIGSYKLTVADNIPDDRQEYVLILAKLQLIKYLMMSLATQFLTNDMSMGQLLQLEQDLMGEAETFRASFRNTQVIEL